MLLQTLDQWGVHKLMENVFFCFLAFSTLQNATSYKHKFEKKHGSIYARTTWKRHLPTSNCTKPLITTSARSPTMHVNNGMFRCRNVDMFTVFSQNMVSHATTGLRFQMRNGAWCHPMEHDIRCDRFFLAHFLISLWLRWLWKNHPVVRYLKEKADFCCCWGHFNGNETVSPLICCQVVLAFYVHSHALTHHVDPTREETRIIKTWELADGIDECFLLWILVTRSSSPPNCSSPVLKSQKAAAILRLRSIVI